MLLAPGQSGAVRFHSRASAFWAGANASQSEAMRGNTLDRFNTAMLSLPLGEAGVGRARSATQRGAANHWIPPGLSTSDAARIHSCPVMIAQTCFPVERISGVAGRAPLRAEVEPRGAARRGGAGRALRGCHRTAKCLAGGRARKQEGVTLRHLSKRGGCEQGWEAPFKLAAGDRRVEPRSAGTARRVCTGETGDPEGSLYTASEGVH